MFSHFISPNYEIPKEFKLHLTNTAMNTSLADIYYSVSLNKIKLTLYEKIDPLILQMPSLDLPPFSNIYIDFNQGMVFFAFNTSCYYKNITFLKTLTSELFIKSYDLVTFFQDKPDFYQYVFTNPFNTKGTSHVSQNSSIFGPNMKQMFDEVDKRGVITFFVNKVSETLEKIFFQYDMTKILDLQVTTDTKTVFDPKDFVVGANCTEIKTENVTNSTTFNQGFGLVKNSTNKFLGK